MSRIPAVKRPVIRRVRTTHGSKRAMINDPWGIRVRQVSESRQKAEEAKAREGQEDVIEAGFSGRSW